MSRMRLHRNVNQVEASADEKLKFLSKPDQPTNQGQHDLFWTRQKNHFFDALGAENMSL